MDSVSSPTTDSKTGDGEPTTYAAFSPASSGTSFGKQHSTVLIHQKTPLLLATPPQITRALAYSHPFLSPINEFLGLVSWTTDDPWESFLLVAGFWAVTLYGDVTLRWAGPPLFAVFLIVGLYVRRYSPLSSLYSKPVPGHSRSNSSEGSDKTQKSEPKQQESQSRTHQKSLDEIVASLQTLTQRCNILLQPFIEMTSFLSTQITATSTTTSPALTSLFVRLLFLTPIWYFLTLPPLRLITTKRVVLSVGTVILTFHSRPARISRTILRRSKLVRRMFSYITGLAPPGISQESKTDASLTTENVPSSVLKRKASSKALSSLANSSKQERGTGQTIRFTFALFENQRRWLGIGWTANMLAYERAPWTDEELNPTESKDEFSLPRIDGGIASWRWAEESHWVVDSGDNSGDKTKDGVSRKTMSEEESGWVYTDTKWRYPIRGKDSWGKYTRRRKWVRDAELVDLAPAKPKVPALPPRNLSSTKVQSIAIPGKAVNAAEGENTPASNTPVVSPASAAKKSWFRKGRGTSKESNTGDETGSIGDRASSTFSTSAERTDDESDGYIPMHYRGRQGADWGIGDDMGMEFG